MKNKILKLVNSLEFQELKSYCSEKTLPNDLDVECNENYSNAFIAWWLNPKSDHGLGDAPLKLFLRLAATKSWGEAIFGVDGFDGAFYNRVLAGSYNVKLLEDIEIEKDSIDIWTVLELSYEEDGRVDRRIIPLVIENRLCNNEGKGQSERYLKAVTSYPGVENTEIGYMGMLLTEEPVQPSCNQFDNITYQDLLTYVIEPLVPDGSSQKEESLLQRIVDKNRDIFDTAFSSLYKISVVEEILDDNSKVLEINDSELNILRMLWGVNNELFKAVIYHLYKEQHKAALDKLFMSSNRDTGKYIVYHKDQAVFPSKTLSKAMAACAIFKAYLKEYPATSLDDLQKAFPCEQLNGYYYDRYYSDLFYDSNPNNIDCDGEQILQRTAGKNVGSEALAKWDFFLDDDHLLPIENGTEKAMCVKIWRTCDFDRLINHVHDMGFGEFISIEEC